MQNLEATGHAKTASFYAKRDLHVLPMICTDEVFVCTKVMDIQQLHLAIKTT